VTLNVPKGQDATIALAFGDITKPRSAAHTRTLIFVNGWNMGQFIANVGPQRVFPIPEGVLNHHGANTIALAVTSDGAAENAPEPVRLMVSQTVMGGVAVKGVLGGRGASGGQRAIALCNPRHCRCCAPLKQQHNAPTAGGYKTQPAALIAQDEGPAQFPGLLRAQRP
jgi:hypothetical protein